MLTTENYNKLESVVFQLSSLLFILPHCLPLKPARIPGYNDLSFCIVSSSAKGYYATTNEGKRVFLKEIRPAGSRFAIDRFQFSMKQW